VLIQVEIVEILTAFESVRPIKYKEGIYAHDDIADEYPKQDWFWH
jgi:hypothetical protein